MAPASSNKPVALQITLVGFVLLSLILAITTYMFHRQFSDAQAAAIKANADMTAQKTLYGNANQEARAGKEIIGGANLERMEGQDPADPTTVRGFAKAKMNSAGTYAGTNLIDTIDKLLAALGSTDENRKQIVDELNKQNQEVLALRARYDGIANESLKSKQKSEADLRDVQAKQNEIVNEKLAEIAALRQDYNNAQAEIANLTEQREKDRKKTAEEISRLEGINDKIRAELDELKQVSFEVADGKIRHVENSSRLVWLDLGSADHIRPRITFSVYAKDNSGIGRGREEIKGKIEVTRVIDAHMSEAKIIEEDLYRPMAPGDQIYSPLWNPGRIEQFSVVGALDLDRDGRSDRELFHQIVATAGAAIDNEVDDDGNRTPEGNFINERTKFLVLGDIPDISQLANEEDRKKAQAIQNHLKDMRKEARLSGTRIVSLNDFLAYIGYKPKRRLFQPGQERPYNLTKGAHSTSVDAPLERNRESTGNVSGAVNKKPWKKQDVSPGETSKLFGTKKDY